MSGAEKDTYPRHRFVGKGDRCKQRVNKYACGLPRDVHRGDHPAPSSRPDVESPSVERGQS